MVMVIHRIAACEGQPMYITIREEKSGRYELFQPDLIEELQIMTETAMITGSPTSRPVSVLAWLLSTVRAATTLH